LLVVDDDRLVRRNIIRAFSRTTFQIVEAEDGAPALELAAANPPDLVLVDFSMPTPGLDVVRSLRDKFGAAIWIGVLTGNDDEATRSACFLAGADDVLAKPFPIGELRRRLAAAARAQQAYVESRVANERADRRIAYGAEAAAMLAHDLNNGLAVALSNLSFVHDTVKLETDPQDAIDSTLRALRRMSSLVANFVDIARFEDAAVKPSASITNVRSMLEAVVDVHRVGTGSSVTWEIECTQQRVGFFDAALIERVLHNLVGNASRYCKTGTIRITADAWDPHEPTSLEIVVYNSGRPIPADVRERLFKKYGTGSGGQRGFGLYFSRLACEAHGGTIECLEEKAGARFAFRLPGRR
jgi:signal transduction histidine kinase